MPKGGFVAENTGNVGKLNVEITADPSKLKTAMGEAKAVTQEAAASMGAAAQEGGGKIEEVGRKSEGLLHKFKELHHFIRSMLVPVMLFKEGVELVKRLVEATEASDRFKESIQNTFTTYMEFTRKLSTGGQSAEEKQIDAIRETANAAKDAIRDQAEELAHAKEMMGAYTAGLSVLARTTANAFGADIITPAEIRAAADEQIAKTTELEEQNVRRVRRAERIKEEQAFWDAATKQMEEFYAKRDRMEQDYRENVARWLKEEMDAQDKSFAEFRQNQRRNLAELSSALGALAKSQRGFTDSNRFAIDINRLAAAVEDIARSPRGIMMGGGF